MKCTEEVIIVLVTVAAMLSQSSTGSRQSGEVKPKNILKMSCNSSSTCPTWFICTSKNSCECGNRHHGMIACDNQKLTSKVLDCHCVTFKKSTGSTFAGKCFYNCENHHSKKKNDLVYNTLPEKPDNLLNYSICSYFHRVGILCGDCEEGYSPLVLSYSLSCVKCPDGHKNWWKFIVVAFVPLTFFYFFVVLFNINVTSSRLHGVVWFSQALSTPILVRMIMSALSQGYPRMLVATKVLIVFFSFWNLDMFRSVIPDICLNVSTLQILALEYIVALYPLLLMLTSYIFIALYDRKFTCVAVLWKPFHKLLTIFRKSWDVRTSVIDSFATFFLLSYIKVVGVTTDLLIPTDVYTLGSNRTTLRLYYSPTVIYFGSVHLPYAILSIVIFAFLVCIPTLIFFLYPFQLFQKCLSIFPLNWHFLRAFVDSFQGCYKDGTEPGTYDCRWFSALFLIGRILAFLAYAATSSILYFVYGTLILLIILIATINIQPFKKVVMHYPSSDSIFLIVVILFHVASLGRSIASVHQRYDYILMSLLILVSAFVPIVYILLLILHWFVSGRRWISSIMIKG